MQLAISLFLLSDLQLFFSNLSCLLLFEFHKLFPLFFDLLLFLQQSIHFLFLNELGYHGWVIDEGIRFDDVRLLCICRLVDYLGLIWYIDDV